jgi:hypothetical protein
MKHEHGCERNAQDTVRIEQVSSITLMDEFMKACPRCYECNVNDVMKDESLERMSCELSLPRGEPHNVMNVYAKGYPISHRDKSQSERKLYMRMHSIVL